MKLILKIARTELRNLFYSPIAWFLTIVFIVQCAVVYMGNLHSYAVTQEEGGIGLYYMTQLTYQIFNNPYIGVFTQVMKDLYLYIPLLTMGLISREINGGTISLLYSSPVKVREIVFGKYVAMMVYSLVLVAIVGIFMISGAWQIKSEDVGMLWAAALGFYLLLCTYSAIGLFMSSLTSYQVVAAISTFVMIGILSYIGGLWQGIAFVRDLTYFLSLSGRTQNMLRGLITTKDVIYFILIVFLFLGCSIYKLKGARETKPWYIKASRYVVVFVIVLLIGYVSSRPALIGYWDTTANKDNTLTPNAQHIIKEFGDAPLTITAYSNYLDNYYFLGKPDKRNEYLQRWDTYLRFKPDIDFHFVYYYDTAYANGYDMFQFYKGKTMKQIVEQQSKANGLDMSMFKTPPEIHQLINLKPELNRFVMQLKYKGRTTFLRVFDDQMVWPSETEVSAAFKRLLQAKMPVIAFATGNGERNVYKKGDREYKTITNEKTFRYALINQGFDVDTFSLEKENIPDSIAALVIADPITSLSAEAMGKIQAYINQGGNLMIMGEPGRQNILNPVLKPLGVQMMDGMLESQSSDYAPYLELPHMTKEAISFSKTLTKPSIDTLPVSMPGVAGLAYLDTGLFQKQPLLVTRAGMAHNTVARNPDLDLVGAVLGSDSGEMNSGTVSMSSGGGTSLTTVNNNKKIDKKAASPKEANGNGKVSSDAVSGSAGTFTTALAITRNVNGKQQRIIVTGDADFMSNVELGRRSPRVSNFSFCAALFSWLDYGHFPIDTSRPDAKDNRVRVSTDETKLLKIIYVWLIPALLLIGGSILLIRRKRK